MKQKIMGQLATCKESDLNIVQQENRHIHGFDWSHGSNEHVHFVHYLAAHIYEGSNQQNFVITYHGNSLL